LTKTTADFTKFLCGWRNTLRHVLATDPDEFIGCNHAILANSIDVSFPDVDVLRRYVHPLTSFSTCEHSGLGGSTATGPSAPSHDVHSRQPCLGMLASFCARQFQWDGDAVISKMHSTIWEGACLRTLCGVSEVEDVQGLSSG
jgi:hypothetical protein